MLFEIRHLTRYRYSSPVRLGPQWLRFHPRNDATQQILSHHVDTLPAPVGHNLHLDLEGNRVTQLWFDGQTDQFEINVTMQVRTLKRDAFAFILLPEATRLPIAHNPDNVLIRGYLQRSDVDETVTSFARDLGQSVDQDSLRFLERLNRTLFSDFERVIRHTGEPQRPAHTLQTHRGACRDLSVLFVDCCRAQGIPARFVSGYQKGDGRRARRYLHAWPEVYLPGAGWRAYDPTHGETVTDTHVAIAAAAHPRDTMPVSGGFYADQVTSTLDFELEIKLSEV